MLKNAQHFITNRKKKKIMTDSLVQNILFEIGSEEIPSVYLVDIEEKLTKIAQKVFEDNRLATGAIKVYYTPRRLTLIANGVAGAQESLTEELKGPPKSIAFEADGTPKKPAEAFCAKAGIGIDGLEFRTLGKKEYLFAVKSIEGKPTLEILPEVFCQIIESLRFPKTMRWNSHTITFTRPIRWLAALYGTTPVEFSYGPVKAGCTSWGHRFLGENRTVEIKDANEAEYLKALESVYVIADQAKRRGIISKGVEENYKKLDIPFGPKCVDEEILTLTVNLNEYPVVLMGRFEENFLELPEEVPVTVMKKHQRYFPVKGADGKLKPYFMTVSNISSPNPELVIKGNERVLRARLSDAVFFWEGDTSIHMEERTEMLKDMIFQKELGSYYQKVVRVKNIIEQVCRTENPVLQPQLPDEAKQDLLASAHIYKCDLISDMVKELTELQGIMGCHYALREGKNRPVCEAIKNHYFPRDAEDNSHTGFDIVSNLLNITDKTDTIAGCFSIGLLPSGSQDPYGLRRQGNGLVKIGLNLSNLASTGYHGLYELDLEPIIGFAFDQFEKTEQSEERKAALKDFFKERILSVLKHGDFAKQVEKALPDLQNPVDVQVLHQIIDAVTQTNCFNLSDVKSRIIDLVILHDSGRDVFAQAAKIMERTKNISKKATNVPTNIDPELLEEQAEKDLYKAFESIAGQISGLLNEKNYLPGVKLYGQELFGPVNNFFDNVLVNSPDEKVKNNRMALMKQIFAAVNDSVGDLSSIAEKG